MQSMQTGSRVRIRPTNKASDELRLKIAALGEVYGEIGAQTGVGVCTVFLPPGVSIPGHSHPMKDGRAYVDIHHEHLAPA